MTFPNTHTLPQNNMAGVVTTMAHNPGTNLCPRQILITVVKATMKSKVWKKRLVQLTAYSHPAEEARA